MSGDSQSFSVETSAPKQSHDITELVREVVRAAGKTSGLCHVMVLHSTAAIVVNETDDPSIGTDIQKALDRAVPDHAGWLHDRIDDNAHSHIKAAILGPSESLPVRDGDLVLGTWQRIILMEFDGPRSRRIHVQLLG
ncbi:MAG: YjbQ family protein [Deltaproteobacteria bacterium]|nr:YjbQ family protein [Deltaproteobacteria bacterium]MBW2359573.1 YjbQ family protein [Deltaproteobacteria bacterium]